LTNDLAIHPWYLFHTKCLEAEQYFEHLRKDDAAGNCQCGARATMTGGLEDLEEQLDPCIHICTTMIDLAVHSDYENNLEAGGHLSESEDEQRSSKHFQYYNVE
jgi:hypothetical protein